MEFINFSETEISKINKALSFIAKQELNPSIIPTDLPVTQTDSFLNDCEQFLDPERTIGTENMFATLVFPNNRTSTHKLFLNKAKINGLSYIHSLTGELVNLNNFCYFFKENGHMYTFTPEKMMERYYHEFLLWSKFLAAKVSTRVYMLMMWHEVNGDAPPADGKYQFEEITLGGHNVGVCLDNLEKLEKIEEVRDMYWDLLVELSIYFGMLSFYQKEADPTNIDPTFPADSLDKWLGMDDVLRLYQLMQNVGNYTQWAEHSNEVRKCVIRMEQHCKGTLIKKQKTN